MEESDQFVQHLNQAAERANELAKWQHAVFVYLRLPENHARYYLPPLPNPDPDIPYGIVFLANRRIMKRCFQAVVRYLDPQSVMKLRMTTKEINREGDRAMYRVWRYLVAVNLSSPFITLPDVGGGEGQMSYTKGVYDLFFANKNQEVLIMGGLGDPNDDKAGLTHGIGEREVTKMIIEPDGTIRFEDSTPMLLHRASHSSVYHQGEVLTVTAYEPVNSRGTMERLDTLTQTQTLLVERLYNDMDSATVAIFNNKLHAVSGRYFDADDNIMDSDIIYELVEHESQADLGTWRAQEARLSTGKFGTTAIAFEGKLWACGGTNGTSLPLVECFDPEVGVWQEESKMTKPRCALYLFVYQEELYALSGDRMEQNVTMEKRNKVTKKWELVTDSGQNRYTCSSVFVGSRVYILGGIGFTSTFDFFDLRSMKWASQDVGSAYFDEATRQLPRPIVESQAVLITPPAAKAKEWTNLNVVKLEDRGTARFDQRFEAITGKAIDVQWDA